MFRLVRPYILCFVTLSFLSGASLCLADNKSNTAKKDISGIKKKINAIEKKLNKTKAEQNDVADALKKSETAISLANKKIYEIKLKQKENEVKLNTLKKQSISINAQLGKQQKQLSKLLYQQYVQGNQSYAKLILES